MSGSRDPLLEFWLP